MTDIHIKVSGPGGVISIEAAIIKAALEEYGCKVTVNDPHPGDGVYYIGNRPVGLDELVEHLKAEKGRGTRIKIDLNHIPWGG